MYISMFLYDESQNVYGSTFQQLDYYYFLINQRNLQYQCIIIQLFRSECQLKQTNFSHRNDTQQNNRNNDNNDTYNWIK